MNQVQLIKIKNCSKCFSNRLFRVSLFMLNSIYVIVNQLINHDVSLQPFFGQNQAKLWYPHGNLSIERLQKLPCLSSGIRSQQHLSFEHTWIIIWYEVVGYSLGRSELSKNCLDILVIVFLCNIYHTLHEKNIPQLLRPIGFC